MIGREGKGVGCKWGLVAGREGNEGKRRRVVTATSTSIGYVYYIGLDKLLLLLTYKKKKSIFFLMHILSCAPVGRSLETYSLRAAMPGQYGIGLSDN